MRVRVSISAPSEEVYFRGTGPNAEGKGLAALPPARPSLRRIFQCSLFAALAFTSALSGAAAADQAVLTQAVEIFGSSSVDMGGAAVKDQPYSFPLSLIWNGPAPVDMVTRSVTRDGKELSGFADLIRWMPQPVMDGVLPVNATVTDPSRLAQTGEYRVSVVAMVRENGQAQLRSFSVVLLRKAASLQVPSRIKVEQIRGTGDAGAFTVKMTETGGLTALSPLNLFAVGQFRNAAGALLPVTLQTAVSSTIVQPNSTESLTIQPSGSLPLGSSTATLQISAPQLPQAITIDVEYVTRFASSYLLLPLLFGVATGFLLRVFLARRGEVQGARLAAGDLAVQILNQARDERDTEVQKKLVVLADELQSNVAAESTKSRIEEVIRKTQKELGDLTASVAEKKSQVATSIQNIAAFLAPPLGLDSQLVSTLKVAIQRFQSIRRGFDNGGTLVAARELARMEEDFPNIIGVPVQDWLATLSVALTDAEVWLQLPALQPLDGVKAAVIDAHRIQDPAPLVTKANDLARLLREKLRPGLYRSVRGFLSTLADDLVRARHSTVAGDVSANLAAAAPPDDNADPLPVLRAVCALLDAVQRSLLNGFPNHRDLVLKAIQQGQTADLLQAVTVTVEFRSGTPGGPAQTARPTEEAAAQPPPGGRASLHLLAISCISFASEEQPLVARLDADPPLPPQSTVRWKTSDVESILPAEEHFSFKPSGPGVCMVHADAILPDNTRITVKSHEVYVGSLRRAVGIPQFQAAMDRTEYVSTGIVGLITALSGYFLFENDFIGLPRDWFVPFLWGASIDLGMAKVRDIAQPYLSRTLTPR